MYETVALIRHSINEPATQIKLMGAISFISQSHLPRHYVITHSKKGALEKPSFFHQSPSVSPLWSLVKLWSKSPQRTRGLKALQRSSCVQTAVVVVVAGPSVGAPHPTTLRCKRALQPLQTGDQGRRKNERESGLGSEDTVWKTCLAGKIVLVCVCLRECFHPGAEVNFSSHLLRHNLPFS